MARGDSKTAERVGGVEAVTDFCEHGRADIEHVLECERDKVATVTVRDFIAAGRAAGQDALGVANDAEWPRPEDPRKTALKKGLAQLRPQELVSLMRDIETGAPLLLDRDEHGHANYCPETDTFCPLALATVTVDWLVKGWIYPPADEEVARFLVNDMGFTIYNTRGVAGEFYTTNRRADLLTAAREVLKEKERA